MADQVKILIVEDEEHTSRVFTRILEKEGYVVETALNASQALETLESFTPDAIVIDIMLPDRDGFQIIPDIRKKEETKNTPVIVASALSDSQTRNAAQALADAYIEKPFDARRLLEIIDGLLQ